MILFCLQVLGIGFGTVLVVLTLLWFLIKFMSFVIQRIERRGKQNVQ